VTHREAGPLPEEKAAARPQRWRLRLPVKESLRLHADHHRLVVSSREIAAAARPGQFIHVWPHDPDDIVRPPFGALLRRPYSVSAVSLPDEVELLFRVRGAGGKLVASKQAGDMLDVIGPLGNGFHFRDDLRVAVVVAGGVGLAPAPFLVERLTASGARVIVLAGARDDRAVPFAVDRPRAGRASIPALAVLGAEVTFVSEEVEGIVITQVLETRLGEFPTDGSVEAFAIGPRAMLKRLAEVTGEHFRLQVSLEERMACGVGACRSCVVPTRDHRGFAYQTVCRDGPVFLASDIDWERLEP
jgi:dihydroorotate dehydrogenase electron transfer subunit